MRPRHLLLLVDEAGALRVRPAQTHRALRCDRCGCRYLETPETAAAWGYALGERCHDAASGAPCGGVLRADDDLDPEPEPEPPGPRSAA